MGEGEPLDAETEPPARNLLKALLTHEVHMALPDMYADILSSTKIRKKHHGASLIPEFDPDNE